MGTDIYFTNNPAEWERLPGVYVSERDPPGFIRGRNLSTVFYFGRTARGPVTPQKITNPARFEELYGGLYLNGELVNEIARALLNKPLGAFVVRRVEADDAVAASFTFETAAGGAGTAVLRADASSKGSWGNLVGVKITAATDGVAGHFNLRAKFEGGEQVAQNLDIGVGANNLLTVYGDDAGNFVTLTKLADGRPVNTAAGVDGADADGYVNLGDVVAGFTSAVGDDGAIAAADYVAALADAKAYDGAAIVICPDSLEDVVAGGAQATLNAAIVTAAAAAVDRVFLTWSGKYGDTPANEITAHAAQITTQTGRIVWAYNAAKTLDPVTATKIPSPPHHWMASILAQNDVDIHPGAQVTRKQTAGISELYNEAISREDLIALAEAGISTLERLEDGFQFRDAVTDDTTPGKTELVYRRQRDFLQLSASKRLRFYVKERNLVERRAQMIGEIDAFSAELASIPRVVEAWQVLSDEVNTPTNRGKGIELILWRVRLIGHMKSIVLQTDMGTGITIERKAA